MQIWTWWILARQIMEGVDGAVEQDRAPLKVLNPADARLWTIVDT